MPITYTVSIVLDEITLTDVVIDRIFAVLPDAVPAEISGVVTITVPVDASDAEAAASDLVDILSSALPEAALCRLDQDLVSIPDIALRAGRTRESVRLLVEGKRGPGNFPGPIGIVGDGIRVWPWASVLDWFAHDLGADLGEQAIPPDVAAAVDAHLAARRSLTQGRR